MNMHSSCSGFSLIELMTVITIISILAAMAIPSYQQYTKRARFSEVISAVQPFKTAVAIAIQEGAALGDLSNGKSGIPNGIKATKNIATIDVKNSIITATGTTLVNNATYILTPTEDGSEFTLSGTCLKEGLCHEQ